jgi:hypothetical protein
VSGWRFQSPETWPSLFSWCSRQKAGPPSPRPSSFSQSRKALVSSGRPEPGPPRPKSGLPKREAPVRYGGSFKTRREASERQRWIGGELAAKRVPEIRFAEQQAEPTLIQAYER